MGLLDKLFGKKMPKSSKQALECSPPQRSVPKATDSSAQYPYLEFAEHNTIIEHGLSGEDFLQITDRYKCIQWKPGSKLPRVVHIPAVFFGTKNHCVLRERI